MEWARSCILSSHVGSMARQRDACVDYAREHQQFGKTVGQFQSVSNRIADMKVRLETARLLLYKVASMKQQGEPVALESSMTELFISESFAANSLDAMRVHGARGCLSDFEVERDVRDALGEMICGGTSDIQRNISARILGSWRVPRVPR